MSSPGPILAKMCTKKLISSLIRDALDTHKEKLSRYIRMLNRGGRRSLIVIGFLGIDNTEITTEIIEKYS